jgi:hypothetical protein
MRMFVVEFYTVEEILYQRNKEIKKIIGRFIPVAFFAFFLDAGDA